MNEILRLVMVCLICVFMALKVHDIIDWSWWWIFSPFWIPVGLAFIIFLICLLCRFIYQWKSK
jgi:hypothetical protein